jgi:hypothetical protein
MVRFDQLKFTSPVKYVIVTIAGMAFSLLVWKVMAFEFRHALALSGGLIMISFGMMAIFFIEDFLIYAFIFNIPFAIFAKTFFNHPEALIDIRGVNLGITELLILGAYGVWFCRIFIARKESLPKLNIIDYLVMLFIISQVISLLGAPNTVLGIFQIIYSIKLALIYFFIAHKVQRRHLRWVVILLLFAIMIQSFLSVYEFVTGNVGIGAGKGKTSLIGKQVDIPGLYHFRASGTTDSSHSLGLYFAMLLPVSLVFSMMRFLKARYRLCSGIIFCLGAGGLVLTFTRGGWLAFMISTLLLIAVIILKEKQGGSIAAVFLSIAIIVSLLFPQSITLVYDRFKNAPSILMSSRYNWNKTALSIWGNHILFGCGTGNYMECLNEPHVNLYDTHNWPVHNIYLYIGSEMGLVGFIAFFGIIFIALRRCIKLFTSHDMMIRALALAIATALLAYLFYGLVNMAGKQIVPYYQFWAYIGLTAALTRHLTDGKTDIVPSSDMMT